MTTHPPAPMPTERGTAVENESEPRECCGEMRWLRSVCEECGHQEAWCASHGTACGCPTPAEPDAGDVEADLIESLAEVAKRWGVGSRHGEWSDEEAQRSCARDMRGQMTIYVEDVRRKSADDRAERIAQAIEAARDVSQAPNYRAGFDVAARIALETR